MGNGDGVAQPRYERKSSAKRIGHAQNSCAKSNTARYSISSLANARTAGGTESPSASADFKLMISSTFTAC